MDLRATLQDLANFLERYGDDKWAPILRQKYAFVAVDCKVLRELKGMFGGWGSLTDLAIARENGHLVADLDETRQVNKELSRLRSKLYATIKELMSDFGCDGR